VRVLTPLPLSESAHLPTPSPTNMFKVQCPGGSSLLMVTFIPGENFVTCAEDRDKENSPKLTPLTQLWILMA